MKHATGDVVVALDADSFIMPDVLKKLVPCFQNKDVMAVIPSVKIWKPKTFLQYIQFQEFLSAVFVRNLQAKLGSIPLAPGAFTLIRKSFVDKYGLLNHKTMVEDLEMSLRIQSEGYLIENVISANVYTSGVTSLKAFLFQRLRWFCGFMIQLKKYKHLFSLKYGNLGLFVLPSTIFFVFLSIMLFFMGLALSIINTWEYLQEVLLIGITLPNLQDWVFDPFFLEISNKTVLPVLLLIIAYLFTKYIQIASREKQGVTKPFIYFVFTYWLIGTACWLIAIYYYIKKKKIRWGPNYFNS
jgi:cellulose synthase/poly-beta-1,6-N-acetylglucosamine synthase-like glycosyltransferase